MEISGSFTASQLLPALCQGTMQANNASKSCSRYTKSAWARRRGHFTFIGDIGDDPLYTVGLLMDKHIKTSHDWKLKNVKHHVQDVETTIRPWILVSTSTFGADHRVPFVLTTAWLPRNWARNSNDQIGGSADRLTAGQRALEKGRYMCMPA